MAKTYEGLRADANIIKNEVEAQKNTATRVGTMFVDVIDKMEESDETQLKLSSVLKVLPTKYSNDDFHKLIDSVTEQAFYQGYWGKEKYMLDCVVHNTTVMQCIYGNLNVNSSDIKRLIVSNKYRIIRRHRYEGTWSKWEVIADAITSVIKALPTKYSNDDFHELIDSVTEQALYQGFWGTEKYMLDCVVHGSTIMQCIYGNLNVDSSNTKRLIVSNKYRIIRRHHYEGTWSKWEVIADAMPQEGYRRKVLLLGDSQVAMCKSSNYTLEGLMKSELKTDVYNFGFAGSRWAYRTEGSEYNAFSVLNVLSTLCNKDTSAMDGSVGSVGSDYLADYRNTLNNLKSFLSTVDMGDGSEWAIVVSAGGNDFNGKTPLTDIDDYTLFGAMKDALGILSRTYPAMIIHIISPTYKMMNDGISSDTYTHWVEPVGQMTRWQYGDKILDYARQEFRLPTFDMYHNGGRNAYNIESLCPDGIHPTSDAGVKSTADIYVKILNTL